MAFNAALKPDLPTAPAMMMLGVMEMLRVSSRRSQGATVQFSAPSLIICPAIVAIIPAESPDRSRARAKMVPATGAMVLARRSWMEKRSASCAAATEEREAPAVIRMALLTKRANRHRDRMSSMME